MTTREKVVEIALQTLERPFECIQAISAYATWHFDPMVPYSHIWTSYIAYVGGLMEGQAPFTASCDRGANWFRKRKRFKVGQAYGGDYRPRGGDYIYFSDSHEQYDATHVGIVLECDETFVTFIRWDDGMPMKYTWYAYNEAIIGYGTPEYLEEKCVDLPGLALNGKGVVILGEDTYVHFGPDVMSNRVGTLRLGRAVEVLETTPNGWLKIVWALSTTGYGYLDNTKLLHKVLNDDRPYQRYVGFQIGDKVQVQGGRLYKQPNTKGKSKPTQPFVGQITGINDKEEMFHIESGKKQGWFCQKDVDFVSDIGYNKHKGEVTEEGLALRVGPGEEFTKVQKWPQLARGNVLDVLGVDEASNGVAWYHVVIAGVYGYVKKDSIKHI